MPLLRKPVLLPVEGLDYSKPSTFINDRAGFPRNMRFWRNELRSRPGLIKYGSVVISGTRVMGLGKLELKTGSKYLIRTSKTKTEKYNSATGAWNSISGTDWSGGDDDFHFFANCSANNLIAFTNGVNVIRKWTGAGNNAALGGSPPKAKFMTYLSPYLLLAYVTDNVASQSWKVQWPDTNDPETWSGGNAGALLCEDEPSPIRNILKLNEFAAVYKRESLWLVRKVTNSDIFARDCIKTGIGLAASRAVADVEGWHYFMGLNNFYRWNGIRIEPIGNPVRDEVFSRINRERIGRCFALHIQELNEVWFFIMVSGEDWPTEVWKFNYHNGFWYYDILTNAMTAAIKWELTTTQTWDDDSGTWDQALDRWDDGISMADWEEVIFGAGNAYTYKLNYAGVDDDGTAVINQFITRDHVADVLERYKRWLQLDIWARGLGTLHVFYSIDEGSNWKSLTTVTLTDAFAKHECYFDIVAEKIRFKMYVDGVGERFYLRNYYPYFLGREEIKA